MDDFSVDFGDATDGAAGVAEDGKSRSGMTEQLLVVMLKLVIAERHLRERMSKDAAALAQQRQPSTGSDSPGPPPPTVLNKRSRIASGRH